MSNKESNSNIQDMACPSNEELSAWLDGESADHETLEHHVRHCFKCRKVVQAYREIDHSIDEHLERTVLENPGILARIRDRTLREVRRLRPTPLWQKLCLGALVIGAGFMLLLMLNDGNQAAGRITSETPQKKVLTADRIRQIAERLKTNVNLQDELVIREIRGSLGQKPSSRQETWTVSGDIDTFGAVLEFLRILSPPELKEKIGELALTPPSELTVTVDISAKALNALHQAFSDLSLKPGGPLLDISGTERATVNFIFRQ